MASLKLRVAIHQKIRKGVAGARGLFCDSHFERLARQVSRLRHRLCFGMTAGVVRR
jgi:hypothetical protein